ncbi:helix-turn-helix domain-containing protein [Flavobacterium geliluteum]|uniref:AraC family transcriptional regulator n=1 Tax=Flavobacterium geliluteum TaxID=2816120 RepID=A0A941AXW8_9FLAO|nr:helix-turn-helix domain-containing protein [Flavobacterium geliluteum]MBP4138596.1 AraC family transcriptional regulator [Flavobacterium geliluteum]
MNYLYTASATNQLKKWKIELLHFLPVIISFFSLFNFLQLPNETKILVFKNEGRGYETLLIFTLIAIICSGIIYVICSLLLLKKHKKNILNQFSYSEKINLAWLRYLIYGIGLIWIFIILGNDKLIYSVVVLFVIFIGYFGINQVGIFTKKNQLIDNKSIIQNEINQPFDDEIIKENKPSKYLKSGLNQEAAFEIYEVLKTRMTKEQLYVNSELTLVELAQILDVYPNNLSQVINTFEQKNFYDYINTKRVELFLKLVAIPENKKYTILSLAFECGFNSKSSFNKYFKKVTNMTPSEYLNLLKERTNF